MRELRLSEMEVLVEKETRLKRAHDEKLAAEADRKKAELARKKKAEEMTKKKKGG
jgi:prolyl-tRNA editing enzyme YbaK/EbsC (Cys-tRNA(Pro) deacylase)